MQKIRIEAPAKLNLHLGVGPGRPDGYHDIDGIFVALAFGDTLDFETVPVSGETSITMNWRFPAEKTAVLDLPAEKNIIFRTVSLFRERTGYDRGLKITVEKRIPAGGGLGGGSSDAAATLLALNSLNSSAGGRLVTAEALAETGAALGSDVPFFLAIKGINTAGQSPAPAYGGFPQQSCGVLNPSVPHSLDHARASTVAVSLCSSIAASSDNPGGGAFCAARVNGRGERVQPLAMPEECGDLSFLLVNPGFPSDTASAFREIDRLRQDSRQFAPESRPPLPTSPRDWPFFNDFLPVFEAGGSAAGAVYRKILTRLKETGAEFAGLSGSGSTCFGVFTSPGGAAEAKKRLLKQWPLIIETFLLAF